MRMPREYRNVQKTLQVIVARIKRTFPFSSPTARRAFLLRASAVQQQLKHVSTPEKAFSILQSLVASLRQSHTFLSRPVPVYRPREWTVIEAEKRIWLRSKKKIVGEVLNINGQSVRSVLNKYGRAYSYLSPRYARCLAVRSLLSRQTLAAVVLDIRIRGQKRTIRLPVGKPRSRNISPINVRRLAKGIVYLQIVSWANRTMSHAAMNALLRRLFRLRPRGLIIDLRGNGGGNSSFARMLAGHLLVKPAYFGNVLSRSSRVSTRLLRSKIVVRPKKPTLTCPIILLTNVGSFSSTEYFIAGLQYSGRAIVLGERTAGGSGNPRKYVVRCGKDRWALFVAQWSYILPDGNALDQMGISPDHRVVQTLADWRSGNDRGLSLALQMFTKPIEG